ncbi:MAG: insulinase family protein [Ignavibacteriae bacterium]|nr:insulinase family protein [Ignavibacteria bacterium]MBI3364083.1 insulinase family protein [Ignavibacteriota bacterium]
MRTKMLWVFLVVVALGARTEAQFSIPYEQFTLANGLTVILHEDHTVPVIGVNIWYNVGSAREKPGRTGFAHLFEHIMFEGSGHVPEGKFDEWLEAAGGDNNASTSSDRTNYFENIPSNALELPLFLESDRMAYLLDSMSPSKVDGQRDVVKNERRQTYENRPYGMAFLTIDENIFPPDYPYHWPTIGSMEDLTAASYEDVVEFFKKYYTTNNASLVIAGDIDPKRTRALVEKWFADVPAGKPVAPLAPQPVLLTEEKRLILEDKVQLPRLYMAWITPAQLTPGDAELDILSYVLAGGKNSRLYKRLVYDMQIAQDVSAFQESGALCSKFDIIVTARSGHTLKEIEKVVQEEIDKLKREPPTPRELQRAINQIEASFLDRLENIGGKADQINSYYVRAGNPDYFNEDLARYKALGTTDIRAVVRKYIRNDGRVVLSVVPEGKRELAASAEKKEGK